MATLSLSEQQQFANFIGIGQHLHQLDTVWTNQLKQPSISQSDVSTLKAITAEMAQLLMEAQPAADSVATIFPAHTDLVEQTYSKLMSDGRLGNDNKSQWEQMVTWYGNPGHLAVKAAKWVSQRAAQEGAALNAKMKQIEDGHVTSGDLSNSFWCGFFVGMSFASALIGQFESAIPLGAIAGAYCGAASAGGSGGLDFPSAHEANE